MRLFLQDTKGATAVEYALIAALFALALLSGWQTISTQISSTFNTAANSLKNA